MAGVMFCRFNAPDPWGCHAAPQARRRTNALRAKGAVSVTFTSLLGTLKREINVFL